MPGAEASSRGGPSGGAGSTVAGPGAALSKGAHPASRRGALGLSEIDRDQAALFAKKYRERPAAPVAVVIAAYNEAGSVGHVVKDTPGEVAGLATEVIVVVDGASDSTALVAEEAGALVADVPVNRGQGAALRLGYHLARERGARFIITTDADGQWRAEDMERVLVPLVGGEADFVNGSRRLGSTANKDVARNVGVVVFAALISLLTGERVTDPASGLRGLTAELTSGVVLDQPQYQSSELLISAAMGGYRIVEVPIYMQARHAGKTKKGGNLVYGWRFCKVVVATWLRERRAPRSTKTKRS
ncbi:MAG: glycosyltransferase family 2 protein [Actinobacteria bacterium]|nr:glycosyltransferase family 2 protein [Actinomycetota bacterium]